MNNFKLTVPNLYVYFYFIFLIFILNWEEYSF